MRRHVGQGVRQAGRAMHRVLAMLVTCVMLLAVAAAALSWRLAQGPLPLPWAAARVQQAVAGLGGDAQVSLGEIALVWEGFRAGVNQPLEIRLSDILWRDAAGRSIARIPQAEVSLSLAGLLRGRLQPRSVIVSGASLRVWRGADGALAVASAAPEAGARDAADGAVTSAVAGVLAELARPPGEGVAALAALRALHIRATSLAIVDHGLDTTWQLPRVDIDLTRAPGGGAAGTADIDLRLGEVLHRIRASAQLPAGAARLHVTATLPPLRPAELAAAVPGLAPLAALDLPLGVELDGVVDRELRRPALQVTLALGAGAIHLGDGVLPVSAARATLRGSLADLDVELDHLDVAPAPEGPRSRFTGWAHARRGDGRIAAALSLSLDHVEAADLPALWPKGVGGPGTRPWITENVTTGTLAAGHVELALSAPEDFSDVDISYIAGTLEGHGVGLYWLRPVPPIANAEGSLRLLTPDMLEITVTGGQQSRVGAGPPIAVRGGKVILTGLAGTSQFADIDGQLAGAVGELVAVLKHPKLQLLSRRPLPVSDVGGQFSGRLNIDHLPLKNGLDVEDVHVRAALRLAGLRLGGIAGGRDMEGGEVTLSADNDGLRASGTATLAGLPASLTVEEDFRAGPATQVIQKAGVTTTLEAAQLAGFGLEAGDALGGRIGLRAEFLGRRNNKAEATVRADLTAARLGLEALDWAKPAGAPATLEAHLLFDGTRLLGVDTLRASGAGLAAEASVAFAQGVPESVHINHIVLGSRLDARGEIGIPARAEAPWTVTLQGAHLDAAALLTRKSPPPGPARRGPVWNADIRLERVTTANDTALYGLALRGSSDGWINPALKIIGRTRSDGGNFDLAITPAGAGRSLAGSAEDAGSLLRALDVIDTMRAGRMTLAGRYDDSRADHRLEATATITDFALRNGAGFGKLLQAFSVYGLIDVIRTPDLAFTEMVAPFRMANDTIEFSDTRAFNSSLGMTGKGRMDIAHRVVDMQGTIVPIYFLNSLLGRLPLVGPLLSPEKGGGLIAAGWSMRGGFDDPDVLVNPLTAVTPGFLRGVFGIFDGGSTIPVPGDPPPAPRRVPSTGGGETGGGGSKN